MKAMERMRMMAKGPDRLMLGAVNAHDFDAATQHLMDGGRLDAIFSDSKTMLTKFLVIGDAEAVDWLLTNGADPNGQGANAVALPLMVAAINGDADLCRVLIKHGADVNARNSHGQTALMASAYASTMDAADALMDNKAENVLDNNGMAAIDHARKSGGDERATFFEAALMQGDIANIVDDIKSGAISFDDMPPMTDIFGDLVSERAPKKRESMAL